MTQAETAACYSDAMGNGIRRFRKKKNQLNRTNSHGDLATTLNAATKEKKYLSRPLGHRKKIGKLF
jgi:hypothetical protein